VTLENHRERVQREIRQPERAEERKKGNFRAEGGLPSFGGRRAKTVRVGER